MFSEVHFTGEGSLGTMAKDAVAMVRRLSTACSEHRMLVGMPYVTCGLRAGSKINVDRQESRGGKE
jgi:hypothetical protein